MSTSILGYLIFLAGIAQIVLVAGSFAIPKILDWRGGLKNLRPLLRQMFWVYAGYILIINLCFGLVSVCCYGELLNGSKLAMYLTAFIAIYWITRILIQFFYFDRSGFPAGALNKFFEIALVALFIFLSIVYGMAFYFNLKQNATWHH